MKKLLLIMMLATILLLGCNKVQQPISVKSGVDRVYISPTQNGYVISPVYNGRGYSRDEDKIYCDDMKTTLTMTYLVLTQEKPKPEELGYFRPESIYEWPIYDEYMFYDKRPIEEEISLPDDEEPGYHIEQLMKGKEK